MSSPTIPISNPQSPIATPAFRAFLSRLSISIHQGFSQRRPWYELIDRSSMARPDSISEAATRIRKNLSYFKVNYITLLALILAFSILSHPLSLLVLLSLLASWIFLYLFRPSDQPLVILGRTFSDRETLGILVVLTIAVIFLTSVGSLMISALMVGFALVCAHGAFRVPDDLFLDDQEPANAGNLLAQGQGLNVGRKLISYPAKRNPGLVSCLKTSEAPTIAKSDDGNKQGSLEKNSQRNATFPNGFEALVLEVCDETEIAELKLKVGDFEMHLKRNVGAAKAPLISSTPPPPIPTPPMEISAVVSPSPSPSKSSVDKSTPFTNVSFGKSSKLAALEASGASGYVLVASPTVGSFRRNRTVKGKKQPPICKEGDVIKEGQVIGYLDQFGTELPVKSDVAGEVLKLLFNDGGNTSTIVISIVDFLLLNFSNNLKVSFSLTMSCCLYILLHFGPGMILSSKVFLIELHSSFSFNGGADMRSLLLILTSEATGFILVGFGPVASIDLIIRWLIMPGNDSIEQGPYAVGYGDPLIAVLPSFHGINIDHAASGNLDAIPGKL
ncbi:hypothetical protein DKX38_012523 [Salix brachista]|uniref:Lipoyl-binding domain-containing protein n=1 Tax=Salix brachista TaxID=2182728 RepID=A0A5N5LQQ0_9ROSI|nr:hypothetical protein DKX38_012523 [Salix brachista]